VSPDAPTVLLVDLPHDDRAMYAEYLRVCGAKPIEIDNTACALRGATAADVIVTGIRVNGPFDGVELVRRLRAREGTHDKPIIVLTACAFEPEQQRAQAAGCDVFLPKPCLPDRLVSEIRALLTRRMRKRRPSRARANHGHLAHRESGERAFYKNGAMEISTLRPKPDRRMQPRIPPYDMAQLPRTSRPSQRTTAFTL
jgi:two-component system, cell cycle response regulator DivK